MTFLELAQSILKEEKKPLTATEIWNLAVEKGYNKKLNSQGKTPWSKLGAQIYVNSKDNPKSVFAKTDSRPKRFYLKSMEGVLEDYENTIPEDLPPLKKKKFDFLEKDLHKHLSYFVYYHLNCYTKTIRYHISSKKEFAE